MTHSSTYYGHGIADAYFGWHHGIGHRPGCRTPNLDFSWQTAPKASGAESMTVRIVCLNCGAAFVLKGTDPEYHGTTAQHLGYGSPTYKAAGLWVHAGPTRPYEDEPDAYLITRTSAPPRSGADVLGFAARTRGPRGGIKWAAGLGVYDRGVSTVTTAGPEDLPSMTAAVRWVAATCDVEGRPYEEVEVPARDQAETDEAAMILARELAARGRAEAEQ